MFQQFYQGSDLLIWPLVGLVIFFLAFLVVLAYVAFGLRDRRALARLASLPLDEGTVAGTGGGTSTETSVGTSAGTPAGTGDGDRGAARDASREEGGRP